MFKKKSDSGKNKFSLLSFFLHPAVKITGGIFSVLAAIFLGHSQLSRRKKRKATQSEARLASSLLSVKLQDVCHHLGSFQVWLKQQDEKTMDIKEIQHRYAGLKSLYSEWTLHERLEEVLGTVQYDPKIGINVSNGLHELRSLNIQIETILRDELIGSPEGMRLLAIVDEHLNRAIAFFNYINKDAANMPENKQVASLKNHPE